MPEGGSITITAENTVLSKTAPDDLEGEFVAISVTDSGTGIAPDILLKIFDPFFTTKSEQKGSGLGLSQVYGFVNQSGGKVAVNSDLGKGTRFTLYLPRAIATEVQTENEYAGPITGRGTILVVDDNPEVGDAAGTMLRELGYDVIFANDAHTAFAQVGREKPLLVLSDIVMPGTRDGLALARELRDAHSDLPLVLMTGYAKNAPVGEFPVVRKPFSLAELGRVVRSAVTSKGAQPNNLIRLKPSNER